MSFAVILVVLMLVILIALSIAGGWYYITHQQSVAPTDLQYSFKKDDDGLYYYSFNWSDSATDPTTYATSITKNNKTVAVGNTTVSSWTPSKPGLEFGTYTFSVTATTGTRPASEPVTLDFTIGENSAELFYVGGADAYTFQNVDQACSSDSDCPSQMTCSSSGTYCYFDSATIMDLGEKTCEKLGGSLATSSQLTDAFNKGADWCAVGVYSDGSGSPLFGYPTYNPGGGCGISDGDYPTIVSSTGSPGGNTGIICNAIKPAFNTSVQVGDIPDKAVVSRGFSTNLGLWSEYSPTKGGSEYGCTNPNQVCKTKK